MKAALTASSAGDAALSVADPDSGQAGHLVNGTFSLSQAIGAGDALRTGTYSKTLTFTLSTATP